MKWKLNNLGVYKVKEIKSEPKMIYVFHNYNIKCCDTFNEFRSEFKCVKWMFKCTLLLLSGTRAHLLSFEEGSCYILSNRNNCCESLASYGVIFQSDSQPPLKGNSWLNILKKYSMKILFLKLKLKNSKKSIKHLFMHAIKIN